MKHHSSYRPSRRLLRGLGVVAVLSQAAAASAGGDPVIQLLGPQRELSTEEESYLTGPEIAWNPTRGEYFVAWGDFDLYGAAVSVNGARRMDPALLYAGDHSASATGLAYSPVAQTYLAVWRSQDPLFGFNTAVGIEVGADGVPVGPAATVLSAGHEASIVYNAAADEYLCAGRFPWIHAQRLATDGTPLVPGEIEVETGGSLAPAYEVAHSSTTDRYLVTWRDQVDQDVKCRLLAADGTGVTGPLVLLPFYGASGQRGVGVAHDPSRDRFLAVGAHFQGTSLESGLIDSSGSVPAPPTLLESGEDIRGCSVAYDAAHDVYVLAWIQDLDRLCLRLLDPDGGALGAVIEVTPRYARMPVLRGDGAGHALLAWVDERDQDIDGSVHVRTLAMAIADDGMSSFCDCAADAPCGNAAAGGGCANSTGAGAQLTGAGSASVAQDDLVLTAAGLPANQSGVLFMGGGTAAQPFGDGVRCVTPGPAGVFRFPVQNAGPGGELALGPGIAALSQGFEQPTGAIASGSTWYFQAWYRDPAGPCGSTFNLSNALAVTFAP